MRDSCDGHVHNISLIYLNSIVPSFISDIDECAAAAPCDSNAVCTNTIGNYTCACNGGYEGDGFTCTGKCVVMTVRLALCKSIKEITSTPDNLNAWHFSSISFVLFVYLLVYFVCLFILFQDINKGH